MTKLIANQRFTLAVAISDFDSMPTADPHFLHFVRDRMASVCGTGYIG